MTEAIVETKGIFVAYAHRDQSVVMELVNHLHISQSLIYTHEIEREGPNSNKLSQSKVVLLMVSPDFLNSDYCYSSEMARVIEQHEQGKVQVLPVILRPIYWGRTPFANLQVLPGGAQPITLQETSSQTFREVIQTIQTALGNNLPNDEVVVMAQQPTPNTPKTSVIVLQWFSVFLFVVTFITGIISIVTKLDVLVTVITFVTALAVIPISILQINRGAFSFILKNKNIRIQVFGILLLLASLSCNVYIYSSPHPTLTAAPTATLVGTPSAPPTVTPIAQATNQSTLIPPGRQPTISDPLANNSQGFGWDQGPNSEKTGICDFVSGSFYQISAPASNSSIDCIMESPKVSFSNFVYQIRMTILEGVDGNNAEACTTFRVNDTAQDDVCFSQNGYWSVDGSSGTLASNGPQFPYFVTGINQINYITIRASGSTFQVQVNGHDLGGPYTDPGINSGVLGFSLTPDTSESKVAFSDLRLWTL